MKNAEFQSVFKLEDPRPTLQFDLFKVPTREPFFYMYGICTGWAGSSDWMRGTWIDGMVLEARGLSDRRIFYDAGMKLGKELRAGTRPIPEWIKVGDPCQIGAKEVPSI